MSERICEVFLKGCSKRICSITYDKRSILNGTLTLWLNSYCVSTFYNVDNYEFLEDRTYIFIS